jgi:hypothetical protein
VPMVDPSEHDPAVAAFISMRGVTRCPTACAVPTQATLVAADRAALADHAARRERRRAQRLDAWNRRRQTFGLLAPAGE